MTMKKVLAIFTFALFVAGVSAPVFAAQSQQATQISITDEDPKKKESTEQKSEATTETSKKSSDSCGEKTEKAAKTADASGSCGK
ncbi:MAG: hypothetical protein R2751_14210 [Bacteroidales bacterium]